MDYRGKKTLQRLTASLPAGEDRNWGEGEKEISLHKRVLSSKFCDTMLDIRRRVYNTDLSFDNEFTFILPTHSHRTKLSVINSWNCFTLVLNCSSPHYDNITGVPRYSTLTLRCFAIVLLLVFKCLPLCTTHLALFHLLLCFSGTNWQC